MAEAARSPSKPARHTARLASLVFVRCGEDVLLMRHPQTSDRFPGLWNGIGGHVEAGESIHQAALRELREESGLALDQVTLRGVIHESGMVGNAYVVFLFYGEIAERPIAELTSPEGIALAWQPIEKLGDLPLVSDIAELLPKVLASGAPFFATESFDGSDKQVAMRVEVFDG
jgi:8-oxo-dGTP diphosphatase